MNFNVYIPLIFKKKGYLCTRIRIICTRVIYDYNYENESEILFRSLVNDPFRGLFTRYGLLDALY